MKVLNFNAPPGAGKDYAANCILRNFEKLGLKAYHTKFAKFVKQSAHQLYNLPYPWDYFEGKLKDLPCKEFYGKTPREVYIAVSENYFKILHGDRFFGDKLCEELQDLSHQNLIVISDGGFESELLSLIDFVGKSNICIVKLVCEGSTFNYDSRKYLNLEGVKTVTIHNHKTPQFDKEILELAELWRD